MGTLCSCCAPLLSPKAPTSSRALSLLAPSCQTRCRQAYRTIMLSYAGVCSLWIPLLAWMMPSHSFRVGMVYLVRRDWTFEVRLRNGAALAARRPGLSAWPRLAPAACVFGR